MLSANRVVAREDLTVALWGPDAPASAANALQKYVSALRRVLGAERLRTRAPGYAVVVEPAELDLLRFDELVAARRWHDAVGLWRGEPCEDVDLRGAWRDRLHALAEQRDDARGRAIDERLAAGEHAELVPELRLLVQVDPLREQHWARLMRAQHRAGRTAQALATYAELRAVLADQLGVDPAPELRRLHLALLTGDADTATDDAPPAAPTWQPQCQLPFEVPHFAGRDAVERELTAALSGDGTPVVVVSGPPGVGKTALAVRVGHRLRARFPDGQWFARLDGASETPHEPGRLLAHLLLASGLDGSAIPDHTDARAAALRARLADRRVLLVLDDAADSEQVRALLPGAAGSAVLVTSRNVLRGLRALDGGALFRLDALEHDEARELLTGAFAAARVAASPDAVDELAGLCGRLPLALRIAAANVAEGLSASVEGYLATVRDGGRLAALAVVGEEHLAVRAAFDVSYRQLPAEAARAFRLVGLIPGPDFSVDAVAALLDRPAAVAAAHLERLCAASLVQVRSSGRFQLHDLLRLYASELARADAAEAASAARRMYDWHLDLAADAGHALYPTLERMPRERRLSPMGLDAASAVMESEFAGLVAAVRSAPADGFPSVSWLLTDELRGFFWYRHRTSEWRASLDTALDAAAREGDRHAEATMRANAAHHALATGDLAGAVAGYEQAIESLERLGGDTIPLLNNLSVVYHEQGDAVRAVEQLDRALVVCLATRDLPGRDELEVRLRLNLGSNLLQMGRPGPARRHLDTAIAISRESGDTMYPPFCLNGLAEVAVLTDRAAEAVDLAREARDLFAATGHQRGVLMTTRTLADALRAAGDLERAEAVVTGGLRDAVRLGVRDTVMRYQVSAADVCRSRGDVVRAAGLCDAALATARELGSVRYTGLALLGAAACAREQGRLADAARLVEEAVEVLDRIAAVHLVGDARCEQARIAAAAGRPDDAARGWARAVECYRRTGRRHLEHAAAAGLAAATARG